jgi:hypothetical protein
MGTAAMWDSERRISHCRGISRGRGIVNEGEEMGKVAEEDKKGWESLKGGKGEEKAPWVAKDAV